MFGKRNHVPFWILLRWTLGYCDVTIDDIAQDSVSLLQRQVQVRSGRDTEVGRKCATPSQLDTSVAPAYVSCLHEHCEDANDALLAGSSCRVLVTAKGCHGDDITAGIRALCPMACNVCQRVSLLESGDIQHMSLESPEISPDMSIETVGASARPVKVTDTRARIEEIKKQIADLKAHLQAVPPEGHASGGLGHEVKSHVENTSHRLRWWNTANMFAVTTLSPRSQNSSSENQMLSRKIATFYDAIYSAAKYLATHTDEASSSPTGSTKVAPSSTSVTFNPFVKESFPTTNSLLVTTTTTSSTTSLLPVTTTSTTSTTSSLPVTTTSASSISMTSKFGESAVSKSTTQGVLVTPSSAIQQSAIGAALRELKGVVHHLQATDMDLRSTVNGLHVLTSPESVVAPHVVIVPNGPVVVYGGEFVHPAFGRGVSVIQVSVDKSGSGYEWTSAGHTEVVDVRMYGGHVIISDGQTEFDGLRDEQGNIGGVVTHNLVAGGHFFLKPV